ncbi:acetyltransferase [Cupriavidus respiraculi]|uniref:GNAT family N-acetyltransferase n=1 Tax=Cupriavidus respiraculi TaxID=195930 RepID=UPI001C975823|nr:GNAT family N-acetyltransferase [Cupriavidus respiraculi]MBY4949958.1 acetyltransferase [Cupriavidus respiraculi]
MSTTTIGGPAATFSGFRSFEVRGEDRLVSAWEAGRLSVRGGDAEVAAFEVEPADTPALRLASTTVRGAALADATTAAFEALTTMWGSGSLDVSLEDADGEAVLRQRGLLLDSDATHAGRGGRCHADLLWQYAPLWLRHAGPAYPLRYAMTGEKRHPMRPPKPEGLVYARYIPWLQRTMTLHAATIRQDLPNLHRWMNDPDVAFFWQEEGDEEKHRRYLQGLIDDPHMLPLVASFDGEPFGYFEVYWAKENRIAPFYDAHDHDRGWHVLIGEPAFRGKAFLTAWFPAIQHFQFLDDPRTQRIVGEPRADHHRQIANLDRAGFSKVKEFDFPHKRAMLVMLLRERFFGEGLYLPRREG